MIEHEGKPLEELNLEETFELEKVLLKRMQQAHIAGVNEQIQNQIHFFLELVQERKHELVEREKFGLDKPDYDGDGVSVVIGEGHILGENEHE